MDDINAMDQIVWMTDLVKKHLSGCFIASRWTRAVKLLKSRSARFKKGTERLNHEATTCKTSCSTRVVSLRWLVRKPPPAWRNAGGGPRGTRRWEYRDTRRNVQEMRTQASSSLMLLWTFGVRNDRALTSDVGKRCAGVEWGVSDAVWPFNKQQFQRRRPVQPFSGLPLSTQNRVFPTLHVEKPLILPRWKCSSSARFIRDAS